MPRKVTVTDFVLPDWIDPNVWAEFELMRKRRRRPLVTDYARKLIVRKLDAARSYADPNDCLNESTEKSYLTVYPENQLRKSNGGETPKGWEGLKKFSERNSKEG